MDRTWNNQTYHVPVGNNITLEGNLNIPENPRGVVLFAHGSGSSRHSPRNQFVAQVLHEAAFATLLIDLLTADEEEQDRLTGHLRFNIDLLSQRAAGATHWLTVDPATANLKIGYFGASTDAPPPLVAAPENPPTLGAIVSHGRQPA